MHSGSQFGGGHHAVTFYPSDAALFRTVAAFVREGLDNGEPAILIATEPHAIGILDDLRSMKVDVDRGVERGDIIVLDAVETLERVTVDGEIHPEIFFEAFNGALETASSGRPAGTTVRVFGEMVDLLCEAGNQDEAIRMEILGNRLAAERPVMILCGYVDELKTHTTCFDAVRRLHSHIVVAA